MTTPSRPRYHLHFAFVLIRKQRPFGMCRGLTNLHRYDRFMQLRLSYSPGQFISRQTVIYIHSSKCVEGRCPPLQSGVANVFLNSNVKHSHHSSQLRPTPLRRPTFHLRSSLTASRPFFPAERWFWSTEKVNHPRFHVKEVFRFWNYWLPGHTVSLQHRVSAYVRLAKKRNTHGSYLHFYATKRLSSLRSKRNEDKQTLSLCFVAVPQ